MNYPVQKRRNFPDQHGGIATEAQWNMNHPVQKRRNFPDQHGGIATVKRAKPSKVQGSVVGGTFLIRSARAPKRPPEGGRGIEPGVRAPPGASTPGRKAKEFQAPEGRQHGDHVCRCVRCEICGPRAGCPGWSWKSAAAPAGLGAWCRRLPGAAAALWPRATFRRPLRGLIPDQYGGIATCGSPEPLNFRHQDGTSLISELP